MKTITINGNSYTFSIGRFNSALSLHKGEAVWIDLTVKYKGFSSSYTGNLAVIVKDKRLSDAESINFGEEWSEIKKYIDGILEKCEAGNAGMIHAALMDAFAEW